MSEPGERVTAVDRVVVAVRDEILAGRRSPGEPVREEAVAEELGVSRHTVRQAFAVLTGQRLLVSEPYRGVRVTEFDYPQAADLQLLRSALESEAVRTLQRRHGTQEWPAEVLAEARAILAELRDAEGDRLLTQELHARFHVAIVAASGSARFVEACRGLDAEVTLLLGQEPMQYPHPRLIAEHETYLSELPRRGPDAVREHMMASLDLLFPDHARR